MARPGARAARRPAPFALAPSLREPTPSTLSCKRAGRPRLLPEADTRQGRADDPVVTPCVVTPCTVVTPWSHRRPAEGTVQLHTEAGEAAQAGKTQDATCTLSPWGRLRGALLDTRDTVNSRAGSPGLWWKGSIVTSSPLRPLPCL